MLIKLTLFENIILQKLQNNAIIKFFFTEPILYFYSVDDIRFSNPQKHSFSHPLSLKFLLGF